MKKLLVASLFTGLVKSVFSQVVPPDPDIITQVPVDGGIITVLGTSIAYGVYKLKNKK